MTNCARPWLLLLVVGTLGCGGSPASPTTVKLSATAQVAGVWAYRATLTSVSGGECVGALLQQSVGTVQAGTLQVQQTGASLSATLTNDSDGSSCSYSGTAGASSMALNASFCTSATINGIRCSNGSTRNMALQVASINVSLAGSSATGTSADTYNVTTTGNAPIATMTLQGSVTGTRR